MFSRLGSFALALVFSMSASASLVNIDYTAHITGTTGDGLGHGVGDQINGSFVIDLSKAYGQYSNSPTDLNSYAPNTDGLLQSNFATNQNGVNYDFVSIYNNDPSFQDQLSLTKVLSEGGSVIEDLGVGFYFLGLDWINDFSLDNINLAFNDSNSLAYSGGSFARFDIANGWLMTDSANLSFDSVKIVSATVPEPSPLLLFAFGVIALVIRRKMM